VLFGCGNKSLLNAGGIAVVGSRNASNIDLAFTDQFGAKAASNGIAIVSGGARGVDETAMLGAMREGGNVIGIMADGLLKAATSVKWRKGLMDGHVVLVSPFYPEAGFNAGNAMARNKYIYCLADTSLVVHSGKKGGTLNGAEENLKKGWIPLWVKPTQDVNAANSALVNKGGSWCEDNIQQINLSGLFTNSIIGESSHQKDQVDLFSQTNNQIDLLSSEPIDADEPVEKENEETIIQAVIEPVAPIKREEIEKPVDFYQLFIEELATLAITPMTIDKLIDKTGLHKSQVTTWIKRAINDNYVKRFNRPIRYQYTKNKE
jgi:predicted Rossmann fold nucleotide-binding protein DprA/Smf involved in DNA uptake